MNKDKLKQIIQVLIDTCLIEKYKYNNITSNLKICDDLIFQEAVKIYISEQINESKKENIQSMKEVKEIKVPASESQKRYLEGKKIMFPEDISKQEAYVLIKQDKEKY